jgi:hypothetical protein
VVFCRVRNRSCDRREQSRLTAPQFRRRLRRATVVRCRLFRAARD